MEMLLVVVLASVSLKLLSSASTYSRLATCFQSIHRVASDNDDVVWTWYHEIHVCVAWDSHEFDETWSPEEGVIAPFDGDSAQKLSLEPKMTSMMI